LLKSLFGTGDKTVIRMGASVVYDHNGSGLLNTFDSGGSFGLSTGLSNPAGIETAACAPRIVWCMTWRMAHFPLPDAYA